MIKGTPPEPRRVHLRWHWMLMVCIAALGACASKPPKPVTLESEIIAAGDVNPNRRGTAQPVVVHVYYLKQDEAFKQGNFRDLISTDAPPIAADLLRRTQTLIGPGETQSLDEKFDPETKFIGVVAEFTGIETAQWRAFIAVPSNSLRDKLNPFSGRKLQITLSNTVVVANVVKD